VGISFISDDQLSKLIGSGKGLFYLPPGFVNEGLWRSSTGFIFKLPARNQWHGVAIPDLAA